MRVMLLKNLLFVLLFVSIKTSMAQGFYIGASVGQSNTDTGVTVGSGNATLDEKDTGFKLFGGARINNNVSFELHYADFGEASISGDQGDQFEIDGILLQFLSDGSSLTGKQSNIGVSALIGIDDSASFNPYLKVGLQRWDADITATTPTTSVSASESGTDAFFGVGIDIKVAENIKLKAEFERFDIDNDDVDLISIGIAFGLSN